MMGAEHVGRTWCSQCANSSSVPRENPEARAVWCLIRTRKAAVPWLRPTLGKEAVQKSAFLIPRLQRRERRKSRRAWEEGMARDGGGRRMPRVGK